MKSSEQILKEVRRFKKSLYQEEKSDHNSGATCALELIEMYILMENSATFRTEALHEYIKNGGKEGWAADKAITHVVEQYEELLTKINL